NPPPPNKFHFLPHLLRHHRPIFRVSRLRPSGVCLAPLHGLFWQLAWPVRPRSLFRPWFSLRWDVRPDYWTPFRLRFYQLRHYLPSFLIWFWFGPQTEVPLLLQK